MFDTLVYRVMDLFASQKGNQTTQPLSNHCEKRIRGGGYCGIKSASNYKGMSSSLSGSSHHTSNLDNTMKKIVFSSSTKGHQV